MRLLDLCCGEGGAAHGYFLASQALGIKLEITGVDIKNQKHYPYRFIQGDAVNYLLENLEHYDIFHASPPCQAWAQCTKGYRNQGKVYPNLLSPIRHIMYTHNLKGVIENVPGSPLRPDIILKGYVFGLTIQRKRVFELVNLFLLQPGIPQVRRGLTLDGTHISIYGHESYTTRTGNQWKIPGETMKDKWRNATGNHWMTIKGLSQSIPFVYTQWIANEIFPRII